MSEAQQQQCKVPAPSRIWGATPKVLAALEAGCLYRVEVFSIVDDEPEQNVGEALRRLVRYGLVRKDKDNRFTLTQSGIEYCKILPGRNHMEEIPGVENEGRTGWPAPPEELAIKAAPRAVTTTTQEYSPIDRHLVQIQAQTEPRTLDLNTNRSEIDQKYTKDRPELTELERQFLEANERGQPELQQSLQRPRSGRAYHQKFNGFSEREEDKILSTLRIWKEVTGPSDEEKEIVDKIVFSQCMDDEYPSNYKRVKDRQDAATYFCLSLEAFNTAIARLRDHRIAYFYDGYCDKKVGIYLDWLNLLKNGRFS